MAEETWLIALLGRCQHLPVYGKTDRKSGIVARCSPRICLYEAEWNYADLPRCGTCLKILNRERS